MGERQTFRTGDTAAEYYLALPTSSTGCGVLVLHAWWGLSGVFTSVCDRLAEAGFVALAPDLYHGQIADTREQAEALASTLDIDTAHALIRQAITELQARPEIQGRPIGVVGFSLGGFLALALNRGVGAIVTYYGSNDPADISTRSAILGHFAEDDEFEPLENVGRLEQSLRGKGLSVDFHVYPNTRHWFSEENQPGYYDAAAADLARQRTIEFLRRQLA